MSCTVIELSHAAGLYALMKYKAMVWVYVQQALLQIFRESMVQHTLRHVPPLPLLCFLPHTLFVGFSWELSATISLFSLQEVHTFASRCSTICIICYMFLTFNNCLSGRAVCDRSPYTVTYRHVPSLRNCIAFPRI